MSDGNVVQKLPPRGIRTMVEELCRARQRNASVPLVGLHLTNGQELRGWVLNITDAAQSRDEGRAVLVQRASEASGPARDVVYLDLRTIVALTVYDAPGAVDILSFGEIEGTGEAAPTRLALKRRGEEVATLLSKALGHAVALETQWDAVPEDDSALRALSTVMEDVLTTLQEIIHEFGVSELEQQLATIRLLHAEAKGVSRADRVLEVRAKLDGGRAGRLDRAALKKAVEAAL